MPFDSSTLFDVSHLVVFVGGTLVGCAGQYFADRFTDQRRKLEARSKEVEQFSQLKMAMPDLLAEMKQDLENDQSHSVREFVIVQNRRVSFNG